MNNKMVVAARAYTAMAVATLARASTSINSNSSDGIKSIDIKRSGGGCKSINSKGSGGGGKRININSSGDLGNSINNQQQHQKAVAARESTSIAVATLARASTISSSINR